MAVSISTRPTGFNSVHLPIVYTLASTKWPINTVDTARSVNTFTNDNGYTKLTFSGAIKTGLQELEWIKLTVDGVEGIYQIYQVFSDSQITIDLLYDGGNVFGNGQYYYMNYYISVKIYAGLRAAHALQSSKPYALITTIETIPNEDGNAAININDILKSDIEILTNNIAANDIESFTEFYIEYAEAYDYSVDGYTLSNFVSSYTSDSVNYAIAVNSKLPFKNGNGGLMSDFVGGTRKFLTLFTRPTVFEGYYYDLSFLRETPATFTQVRRRLYSGTTLLSTQYDTLPSSDEGLYRLQIQKVSTEDSILVDLWSGSTQSETLTIDVNTDCNNQQIYITWLNYLGGHDYWLFTAQKEYGIDIESVTTSENNILIEWPTSYNAEAIEFETSRVSRETVIVRAENITLQQLEGMKYIKTSPVVQVVTGTENSPILKNILVDNSSFRLYQDGDKLYSFEFAFKFTDTIPSQAL